MTQEVVVRVKVDAGQANEALHEIRLSAENLGGGMGTTATKTEKFQDSLKKLKNGLNENVGGLTAVTVALGQQNDMVGKAAKAVGGFAGMMASTGPLGVALLATLGATQQLVTAMDDLIKKQDGAFAAIGSGIASSAARLKETRLELLKLTETDEGRRQMELKARKESIEAEIQIEKRKQDEIIRKQREASKDAWKAPVLGERSMSEFATAAAEAGAKIKILREELEIIDRIGKTKAGGASQSSEIDARYKALMASFAESDAAGRMPDVLEMTEADKELRKQITKERNDENLKRALDEIKATEFLESTKTQIERDAQQTRYENELLAQKKKEALKDAEKKMHATLTADTLAMTEGGYSAGIGALQGFITDKIAMEKHAEQRATAAFLAGIGQQLVGFGTQQIFKGLAISLDPLTPGMGAPLMAVGVAATAAGIGMGAASAGVSASIPKASSSAGRSMREPREPRGSSRPPAGGRESGANNITIVYGGASGPSADDGARAVESAILRARRRGRLRGF